MITRLAWRNLWRNRRRTTITMASVTFAVLLAVSMKSLQEGVFDNLVKDLVSYYSGYIQIHKKGYWDEQTLDNSFGVTPGLMDSIGSDPNVRRMAGRLESFALASSGTLTAGCMVVGTDPEAENRFTGMGEKVIRGAYLRHGDTGMLVAEELAEKLEADIGDTLILMGQGYQGNTAAGMYPVRGILHFGSPELNRSLVILSDVTAGTLFSASGRLTSLAIDIRDRDALESTAKLLGKTTGDGYEVMTWKEMMPEIEGHIRSDNMNFYLFIGVLYLLIAFGIFGTTLMMINERRYEMGMLVAIGMKKHRLAVMLFTETLFISLMGTVAGLALSYPVVIWFEHNPIRFTGAMAEAYKQWGFDAIWPAVFEPQIFLTQSLVVLSMAIVIGIYPVLHAMRLDVIESMKKH